MSSHAKLVADFLNKNGFPAPDNVGLQFSKLLTFRHALLLEEVDELSEAYANSDMVATADALVDIVYTVLSIAHLHGITPEMWDQLFNEVHRSNMTKTRCMIRHAAFPSEEFANACVCGKPQKEHSTRGGDLDIIKGSGYLPPNLSAIIQPEEK